MSENNTISLSLVNKPSTLFYLSWSVDWLCYCVLYEGCLVLFNDNCIEASDEPTRQVCRRIVCFFRRLDKVDLEQVKLELVMKTFIGEVDAEGLWFTHIIHHRTRQYLPIPQTHHLLSQFSLPYHPTQFSLTYTCNNEWDLISKLTELELKVSRNRHCMDHKTLRVASEEGIILAEFTLKSREKEIY